MTAGPRRGLVLTALAALLAGCAPATGSSARPLPSVTRSDAASGGTASPTGAGALPAPSVTPSGADDAPVLVLQGDGLGLIEGDASVRPLLFATTSGDVVRRAVEDALGPVTVTPMAGCRQGPLTGLVVDGFTVLLSGDAFVGWTDAGAPDRSLTTSDGVGTGSQLPDVQSALPDLQVTTGPAGPAWRSATGLSGLLSSADDPAAIVTTVFGGQTCER